MSARDPARAGAPGTFSWGGLRPSRVRTARRDLGARRSEKDRRRVRFESDAVQNGRLPRHRGPAGRAGRRRVRRRDGKRNEGNGGGAGGKDREPVGDGGTPLAKKDGTGVWSGRPGGEQKDLGWVRASTVGLRRPGVDRRPGAAEPNQHAQRRQEQPKTAHEEEICPTVHSVRVSSGGPEYGPHGGGCQPEVPGIAGVGSGGRRPAITRPQGRRRDDLGLDRASHAAGGEAAQVDGVSHSLPEQQAIASTPEPGWRSRTRADGAGRNPASPDPSQRGTWPGPARR